MITCRNNLVLVPVSDMLSKNKCLNYKQFPNFQKKWQSIPNASQSATAERNLFTCAFIP